MHFYDLDQIASATTEDLHSAPEITHQREPVRGFHFCAKVHDGAILLAETIVVLNPSTSLLEITGKLIVETLEPHKV